MAAVLTPWKLGPVPVYETPRELGIKLAEFLDVCWNGREVYDSAEGLIVEHDASTVPTMTSAAWHCGFISRQSLYDYEKMGDDWKAVINAFREACENWYVTRGIRPKKGDNPIFMSMVLQARYDYAPANKQVISGDGKEPLTIEHKSTPEDVERTLESLGLEKKSKTIVQKPVDKKDQ